ncbi:MAG TPA: S1C family serine protease [Trueperaceae bacterium]|nr:S1C family serine protease [Trueperaceae bacterium]
MPDDGREWGDESQQRTPGEDGTEAPRESGGGAPADGADGYGSDVYGSDRYGPDTYGPDMYGPAPYGLGEPGPPGVPPGRPRGVRPFTLVLVLLLVVVAVFGVGFPRRSQVRHVSQGLPPVVEPTGRLRAAFERARAASVRIEGRCGARYGGEAIGIGTGFFIHEDGLVLTAYHVVDAGTQGAPCPVHYVAVTPRHAEYPLSLVGFDAYHDLAVLRARVSGPVPYVTLAAALPRPGTAVVAVGDSREQFLQARAGEVTRLGVHAGRPDFADNTIEMTNSLAPGDSGGPVVDDAGEAVGVVSYISFDPGAMASNTYVPPFLRGVQLPAGYASYAVPVTRGSELVKALVAGEKRDVPVLGFAWRPGFDYDPSSSDVYLGPRKGVIVWQVQPGGPADTAGLRSFTERREPAADGSVVGVPQADVITAIDGTPTPTFYDLLALVRKKQIGQEVTLSVQRSNATIHLRLRLGAQRAVFSQ